MIDFPCVIFAGGKSSRMGEDKSLLPFGDFPTLTQFQLNRLKKLFKNVYISCKNSNKFDFDANFIEDTKAENTYAPTAGFVAIFEKLKCEKFFALSVDSPFIDDNIIQKLIASDSIETDATIARTPFSIQPMCGIYHKSLQTNFIQMLKTDNHKLGFLLKNSKTIYVDFNDNQTFLNLNHPHEYKKALNLIYIQYFIT
ncbi:MAG: molybdenum cofactor guanylyltransferase MobA [Campylobacterota bacterium]|nr:molybdenum cofactor guanylyltransferase MobA [Campylobacterota bacterium]